MRGLHYSNSLESLELSYRAGCRTIEIDLEWTSDQDIILLHDWESTYLTLFFKPWMQWRPTALLESNGIRTRRAFLLSQMVGNLTQATASDLVRWLETHLDATIITDFKSRNIEGLHRISDSMSRRQFVPQVYSISEYAEAQRLGFERIILALYRKTDSDGELIAFASREHPSAITVPKAFIREWELAQRLIRMGIPVYAHTVNSLSEARQLSDAGVSGFFSDQLQTWPPTLEELTVLAATPAAESR